MCAARGYWFGVFPRVLAEVRRRRELAERIPDPALRELALRALAQKRNNLEGAAAFATLAGRRQRPLVIRALVGSQTICDYLDLLCEEPNRDPIANGRALHESLLDAVSDGRERSDCDYYRHHAHGDDGGYLQGLVQSVSGSLAALPARSRVLAPISLAAERIAAYQSFNHGDAEGSYRPFEQWAAHERKTCPELSWWEAGAAAGSTLTLHVLLAAAADAEVERTDLAAIEQTYFPWIGALHSLLDSLVDRGEDVARGMRGLIDFYVSPTQAAGRMRLIAGEAMQRARALPQGERHALILAAMTSFYLCQLRRSKSSPLPAAVVPVVRDALGRLAAPNMAVLRVRRVLAENGGAELALSTPMGGGVMPELESRKSST